MTPDSERLEKRLTVGEELKWHGEPKRSCYMIILDIVSWISGHWLFISVKNKSPKMWKKLVMHFNYWMGWIGWDHPQDWGRDIWCQKYRIWERTIFSFPVLRHETNVRSAFPRVRRHPTVRIPVTVGDDPLWEGLAGILMRYQRKKRESKHFHKPKWEAETTCSKCHRPSRVWSSWRQGRCLAVLEHQL